MFSTTQRQCSACKVLKPSSDFSENQKKKGANRRCKTCVNIRTQSAQKQSVHRTTTTTLKRPLESKDNSAGRKSLIGETGAKRANTKRLTATRTGIASKVRDLKKSIDAKQKEVKTKQTEVHHMQEKFAATQVEFDAKQGMLSEIRLLRCELELSNLKGDLLNLEKDLSNLKGDLLNLENDLLNLKNEFIEGAYFSAAADVWQVHAVNIAHNAVYNKVKWQDLQRTPKMADGIEVREISSGNSSKPYKDTREGAQDEKKKAPEPPTSRSSASSQGKKAYRDNVWPVDVFGNKAGVQEVSHLLPAGQYHHMQWCYIAAAVVGLEGVSNLSVLAKVTRGYLENTGKEKEAKAAGTGVVHFTTNKLRLEYQKYLWDGSNCKGLFIPIMTIAEAREWNGAGYDALFLAGRPKGIISSENDDADIFSVPDVYRNVGVTKSAVLEGDTVLDATRGDIETARVTLIHAILAIRHLLSKDFTEEIMEGLCLRRQEHIFLNDARGFAEKPNYLLPKNISGPTLRKSVCVVRFAATKHEPQSHPAPDPLLLVVKAATVWAKMVGQPLLANGSEPDLHPDMTEGDYIAELTYYEACFPDPIMPETRQELAMGLGQPWI